MSGKGDWIRPRQISEEDWSDNWDNIFGKKQKSKKPKDPSKSTVKPAKRTVTRPEQ